MPRETIAFPMVALVEGGLTTDGEQVLLQLMTVEDGTINSVCGSPTWKASSRSCCRWQPA
jgi:hypothetical protein